MDVRLRIFAVLLAALFVAAVPVDAVAARACPDTPGSSCKGDSGGWWPDDDDIMRIGSGTGTATVCRHKHVVPYGTYCYQLSSTCTPDVPLPMRRHANPSRDGWASVLRKIDRGGWCVDACAVVNVPPWAPWTKIPGTDYVSRFTVLIDLHDPDDPLDDEYEDREQDCWQEDRVCTEPSTTVAPCGGGPYCYLSSPQTRTQCGPSRGGGDPPVVPPPSCTPARYSWSQWTPAGPCVTGIGGITQTQSESCTAGSGSCPAARCRDPLAGDRTRECAPIDPDCADQPACRSIAGLCTTGNAGPVTTTNTGTTRTDSWSCTSPDADCTAASCSVSTGCSAWIEDSDTEPCVCDGTTENCTRTRTCDAGSCPTTGVCPSHYPRVTTTTTPDSPNCQPGGPQCGLTAGTCTQGSPSGLTVDPCTPRTISAWSPWAPDGPCPVFTESRTRTCSDGSASTGEATWTCTHTGSAASCSAPGTPPSCDWSCLGERLSESQSYDGCQCPRIQGCDAAACQIGQEIVNDPGLPGLCLTRQCRGPDLTCTAGADCTVWGPWANGAPSIVCTTDTTSRSRQCNSGASGCPFCPQTTDTETVSGTKNCTPPACGCGVALFQWCTGFGCYMVNESTDTFGNTTGWDCINSGGSTASCSI